MSEILYSPKCYKILCEGESEVAYIQKVNIILRARNIDVILGSDLFRNGHFSKIEKVLKKYNQKDRKNIKIWVDEDIYKRNEQGNNDRYLNKKNKMPDFLFTKYNFEDFLVMHLDDITIYEWEQKLIKKNHFNIPLKSNEYIPLLKEYIAEFRDYEKGVFPENIKITYDTIKHAYQIHKNPNIKFKSEFLDFLHKNVISLT